jgi:DNA segregation ATPase FtsK/SpoIIIE-like protein
MNPQRICYHGSLKANVPARVGLAMATMADSRVTLRVDQNGAEELTPPGQAILVRGVETVKVMSPFLSDEERAQRLAGLRRGEIELTDAEKAVLHTAKELAQQGQKVTNRGVYKIVRGNFGQLCTRMKRLRQLGLLATNAEAEEEAEA